MKRMVNALSTSKQEGSDEGGITEGGFYDELTTATTTTRIGGKEYRHPASHELVPVEVAKQMEAAIQFCNNLYDHVFRAPQFGDVRSTYSGALKGMADGLSDEDLELSGVVSRAMLIETMLDSDFEQALDPTRRREFAEWRRRNFPEQDGIEAQQIRWRADWQMSDVAAFRIPN